MHASGGASDSKGGTDHPGVAASNSGPAAPQERKDAEQIAAGLLERYAPAVANMRAALHDPAQWKDAVNEPKCVELLQRAKYHLHASRIRGQGEFHTKIVEALAKAIGLSRADLDELETVDAVLIREGRWLPKTARVQRLAMDAHEIDLDSADPIVRFLNHVSAHLPRVKSLKMRDMRAVANGLDRIYAGADFVLDKGLASGLDQLASWFQGFGRNMSSDVRVQYQGMREATRAIDISVKKLNSFSPSDKRMALLCASAMRDVASDIDVWLSLLEDPSRLKDQGFLAKFRNIARVGLDGAVWLLGGAADALHKVFDQENLRNFNVNLLLGAGLEVMFCGGSFGIGLYLPSVNEMRTSEHAAAHVDFAVGAVAPFGTLMASSRGGKKQIRLPFLKVRSGEFSQAIGVGTGLVGGINFLRDKTYGSGVEVGWFPKLLPSWIPNVVTKIFNVRAGGNVVVHHPALRVTDRAVSAAVEATQKPLDALANALVRADLTTPLGELRTKRLQNSTVKYRQVQRVYAAVQSYRLAIESARRAGRPLAQEGTDAHAKLTRGTTLDKAEAIIDSFLNDLSKDCEDRLARLDALLSSPRTETGAEERAIRKSVRKMTGELTDVIDRFNMAEVLLHQVFGQANTKADSALLSPEFLASIRTAEVVHWALTDDGRVYACSAKNAATPSASLLAKGAPTRGSGTFRLVKNAEGEVTSVLLNTTATEKQADVVRAVTDALSEAGIDPAGVVATKGRRPQVHEGDLADALSPPHASGRRTRIIATLAPTASIRSLEGLIDAGMNIARINLSHEATDQHLALIANVRAAASSKGVEIPIIVDLPGPKLRLGKFENPRALDKNDIVLATGGKVTLTKDSVLGTSKLIPMEYEGLANDAQVGQRILLNDGQVELRVASIDKEKGTLDCEIVRGGIIWDNAGMNLPDTQISLPTVSNSDFEKLRPLLPYIDQIGVSFTREAHDITDVRQAAAAEMTALGLDKQHLIVAKIESTAGVHNLDAIARVSDALMVARGDLQPEIGYEKVPEVQARIEALGRALKKPTIVATGVMPSTVKSGAAPSQGETDGLYSVVRYQGAEAILLSRETRSSMYARETLRACVNIINGAEAARKEDVPAAAAV